MGRFTSAISLTVMLAAMVGCQNGTDIYPVTVRVSMPDGQPAEGALVAFHPDPVASSEDGAKSTSAVGKVAADGTCQLTTHTPGDGAVAGRHRVTVAPPPVTKIEDIQKANKAAQIPSRYLRPETSNLEFAVTPDGPNEFEIKIEGK
jgi:hypothetical protein